MLMLLRRSPEQEAALETLLANQQNPASREYHQWLTPEQFGAWFGPADQDVQTIENWLTSDRLVFGQILSQTTSLTLVVQ